MSNPMLQPSELDIVWPEYEILLFPYSVLARPELGVNELARQMLDYYEPYAP
jgi:hypothetical protein